MKHIAIITGGIGSEREVSLRSAQAVQASLIRQGFVTKSYDLPSELSLLIDHKDVIEFAWVMIHGVGGEDGQVVGMLDMLGIVYQCATYDVLALTINKYLTKQVWKSAGLLVARDVLLRATMSRERVVDVLSDFDFQCVIKAIGEGSSKGLIIVTSQDQLSDVYELVQMYDRVLCEEFVAGVEITVAILDRSILPIIEIIPPEGQSFDYNNKYNGLTQEICPARISDELTQQLQQLALQAYDAVGCTRYGRIDMIIGDNGPVLLEINTIPGFTDQSLFPLAAQTAGMSFDELVRRLMN